MAVVPNSVISPQSIQKVAGTTFVNADGTTPKTLCTASASGSVLRGIAGTTNDTSANNVKILIDGVWVGTVRLATLAGTDGAVVARELLNPTDLPWLKLDSAGNYHINLGPASVVTVAPLVAVTAAKTLSLQPFIEDY